LAGPGYFGFTGIGTITPFVTLGAGDPTIFPGTFQAGSLQMFFVVSMPEPGTMALAGLGGLVFLGFRRKQ
jgi:hypothetical protein